MWRASLTARFRKAVLPLIAVFVYVLADRVSARRFSAKRGGWKSGAGQREKPRSGQNQQRVSQAELEKERAVYDQIPHDFAISGAEDILSDSEADNDLLLRMHMQSLRATADVESQVSRDASVAQFVYAGSDEISASHVCNKRAHLLQPATVSQLTGSGHRRQQSPDGRPDIRLPHQ